MRLKNWFISKLDDSQRSIIVQDHNKSIIVQGSAGSGKTNLAIHRAQQASAFGSFVIIVYTIALKKMVQFGLRELGLDRDRVVYEWSWDHRGIEVSGDVFALTGNNDYGLNPDILIVSNDEEDSTRYFISIDKFQDAITNKAIHSYTIESVKEPLEISIDFGDWVESKFYYTFYRRERWFKEIMITDLELDPSNNKFIFIASAFVFKKKEKVDYMIIDEAQDFSKSDFTDKFLPDVNKSLTLFGDSLQKIYDKRGVSLDDLQEHLLFPRFLLSYNYRLPKSIAKVAQVISKPHQDLISNNKKNAGDSDFPTFDKPVIKKLNSKAEELGNILKMIQLEALDDVAILVPDNEEIEYVHSFFEEKGLPTQVRYTVDIDENIAAGIYPKFRTIDSLDFSNNDLPCILTYHSAKGTEFENVFIPFSNDDLLSRSAFYVATSRASSRLFISYSNVRTQYLSDVNSDHVVEIF